MATKLRFTKAAVEALPTPAKRTYYRDTGEPALGLYVTPADTKSYFAAVVVNRKSKRIPLGKHPAMSPDLARRRARETAVAAAEGKDPVQEKRAARRGDLTLARALEDYLAAKKPRASTASLYETTLRVTCPDWLGKPLTSISRQMVLKRYTERAEQSLSGADRFARLLAQVWNYHRAVLKDTSPLGESPTAILSETKVRKKPARRKTVIAAEDLPRWWLAVLELEAEWRDYVLFLALTGCRRTEVLRLDWSDVGETTFRLRAEHTKSGRPAELPLPAYLAELLAPRRRTGPVFPSLQQRVNLHRGGPVGIVRRETGIAWTLHDLRRLYASVATAASAVTSPLPPATKKEPIEAGGALEAGEPVGEAR